MDAVNNVALRNARVNFLEFSRAPTEFSLASKTSKLILTDLESPEGYRCGYIKFEPGSGEHNGTGHLSVADRFDQVRSQ